MPELLRTSTKVVAIEFPQRGRSVICPTKMGDFTRQIHPSSLTKPVGLENPLQINGLAQWRGLSVMARAVR